MWNRSDTNGETDVKDLRNNHRAGVRTYNACAMQIFDFLKFFKEDVLVTVL